MVSIYVSLCNKWKHDTWVFFKNINKTGALILFTYMYLLVSKMFFLYAPSSINSFTCTVTVWLRKCKQSLKYIFLIFGFLLIKFQFDKKSLVLLLQFFSDWFANLKLVWINIWHRSTEKPGKKFFWFSVLGTTQAAKWLWWEWGGRGWEGGGHNAEFYFDVILPYIYM